MCCVATDTPGSLGYEAHLISLCLACAAKMSQNGAGWPGCGQGLAKVYGAGWAGRSCGLAKVHGSGWAERAALAPVGLH